MAQYIPATTEYAYLYRSLPVVLSFCQTNPARDGYVAALSLNKVANGKCDIPHIRPNAERFKRSIRQLMGARDSFPIPTEVYIIYAITHLFAFIPRLRFGITANS